MNRITLLLLVTFWFASTTDAAAKHKKFEKSFKAVQNLKIDSKYGKIQVKHWDKEDIRLEILINVDGSNEEKNETVADNITVDFTRGEQQLVVETVFGDFFSLKKLMNSLFNKGKFKIEYLVQIPSGVNLEIVQKQGDIHMNSYDGKVSIDLANGNFTAQDLNGDNKFKITGATFRANRLGNSEIEIANSEVKIEKANKLSGESRDSEYSIQAIDNLNIKSVRDKFDIKEIEYLYGSSGFSKFEISHLGGEIDCDLKFGHINVFNINNMFSFIKLDSKHGHIALSFMEDCQIDYEINHKSVKFDNSPEFTLINQETDNKKTFVAKGKIGEKEAISKLNIRANNCKVRLD